MDVDDIGPEINNEFELVNEDTMQDSCFISSSTDYQRVDYKSVAASSLLKLKLDHRLSQRTVDDILQMNQDISQNLCQNIKHSVFEVLREHCVSNDCFKDVQSTFDKCDLPFEGLHSAYLQKKYISTNFPYFVRVNMHVICALYQMYTKNIILAISHDIYIYIYNSGVFKEKIQTMASL